MKAWTAEVKKHVPSNLKARDYIKSQLPTVGLDRGASFSKFFTFKQDLSKKLYKFETAVKKKKDVATARNDAEAALDNYLQQAQQALSQWPDPNPKFHTTLIKGLVALQQAVKNTK